MHERTARLHALMNERAISVGEAARLLSRSPQTIYQWRCGLPPHVVPVHQLQLLELMTAPVRKARRQRV